MQKPETIDPPFRSGNGLSPKAPAFLWLIPAIFLALFPFAFINRTIHIDEAWIGEQAYTLQRDGIVTNNLFQDYPPLDGEIVIYHKLPVWFGAAFVRIFGWGLYPLRLISALAGAAMVLLLFLYLSSSHSRAAAITGAMLLLWIPQFWEAMRIFRPEILMTLFGFASFVLVKKALEKSAIFDSLTAGICAGLAGLAHPLGLVFAAAGFLSLLLEKKGRAALVFGLFSITTFIPYISGYFGAPELFLRQLTDNGILASKVSFTWSTPILNLLNEHKRVFRNGDVIGITVLFILTLLLNWRHRADAGKFYWRYLIIVFVLLAIAPFPKITRYYLPLLPFLSVFVALSIDHLLRRGDSFLPSVRVLIFGCLILFSVYGFYALGRAAFIDRHASRDLETNRLLADNMKRGSRIIARFDMVFDYIDDYIILSWWGCEQRLQGNFNPEAVEEYAAGLGVKYIVFTKNSLEQMSLDSEMLAARLSSFTPLLMLPERERYLFVKEGRD